MALSSIIKTTNKEPSCGYSRFMSVSFSPHPEWNIIHELVVALLYGIFNTQAAYWTNRCGFLLIPDESFSLFVLWNWIDWMVSSWCAAKRAKRWYVDERRRILESLRKNLKSHDMIMLHYVKISSKVISIGWNLSLCGNSEDKTCYYLIMILFFSIFDSIRVCNSFDCF